jgi:hypothetical protein
MVELFNFALVRVCKQVPFGLPFVEDVCDL